MESIYEFQRKRSIELGETKLGVQVTSTADFTVYAQYAHYALHNARAPTRMIYAIPAPIQCVVDYFLGVESICDVYWTKYDRLVWCP